MKERTADSELRSNGMAITGYGFGVLWVLQCTMDDSFLCIRLACVAASIVLLWPTVQLPVSSPRVNLATRRTLCFGLPTCRRSPRKAALQFLMTSECSPVAFHIRCPVGEDRDHGPPDLVRPLLPSLSTFTVLRLQTVPICGIFARTSSFGAPLTVLVFDTGTSNAVTFSSSASITPG